MKTLRLKKAFTLSELLVSLSILGLIASISIPKVYNSVNTQKEKAVLKEASALIAQIDYDAQIEGEFSSTTIANFFISKIAAVKACNSNFQSQGCGMVSSSDTWLNSMPGVILQNGATISIDPNGSNSVNYYIDWNGDEGPNTYPNDIKILWHEYNCNRVMTDNLCVTSTNSAGDWYIELFGAS